MPRFALYRMPGAKSGYVVDVQADLLESLDSRVVVPLRRADEITPISGLHPAVRVDDEDYLLATHQLAAVASRHLGPPIGSLAHHQDAICNALDRLLIGF